MSPSDLPLDGPTNALPRGIGRPATAALAAQGITTLKQVAEVSRSDLSKIHAIGPKALRVLAEALEAEGLTFGP